MSLPGGLEELDVTIHELDNQSHALTGVLSQNETQADVCSLDKLSTFNMSTLLPLVLLFCTR